MRSPGLICGVLLACSCGIGAAAQPGFPAADETLNYSVNWPSGLSLGEASISAHRAGDRWEFELNLDAAVPGFSVSDRYRSIVSADLCSLEFDRNTTHGRRITREKTTVDYGKGMARRATVEGGKTEIPVSGCARDALEFVFYLRRELAQGRVPPAQTVLFGSPYQVKLEYGGVQTVSVNEKRQEADRVAVTVKGPASGLNFEMFFGRDAARTPLVVRVPFALGVFSMELAP
jgi:hypothetical protein